MPILCISVSIQKFYYRFENTGLDYAFISDLMESVLVGRYLSPAGVCRAMTLTTQARRIKIEPNVFSDYINPPGTMKTSRFIGPCFRSSFVIHEEQHILCLIFY